VWEISLMSCRADDEGSGPPRHPAGRGVNLLQAVLASDCCGERLGKPHMMRQDRERSDVPGGVGPGVAKTAPWLR